MPTPAPTMQPASPLEPFGTDEILWFNNGKWGEAGYAIPNPGGKLWTNNATIYGMAQFFGRELFDLMHRDDVKFTRPPNKQWLYDCYKMCKLGIKRLADRAVDFNQERLDGEHATPAPRAFVVYPIPFFGERIRQLDCAEYAQIAMLTLSEIYQHSDNDYTLDVSTLLAGTVHKRLVRIIKLMATKFLGYTRDEVSAPDWDPMSIPDVKFSSDPLAGYNPQNLFTSSELTEERQPLRWWPTENDLSLIRAIPMPVAISYGQRWPDSDLLLAGDGGSETAFPGTGQIRQERSNSNDVPGVISGQGQTTNKPSTFTSSVITQPGTAPH